MNNECTISYCVLLKIRLIGECIYLLQYILLLSKKTSKIYLSNQERFLEKICIDKINSQFSKVKCNTFNIGYSLRYIKIPIELTLSKRLLQSFKLSQKNYDQVMWTLLFSNSSIDVLNEKIK